MPNNELLTPDNVFGDDVITTEGRVIRLLREIEARLYAPEPIDADERRDLANRVNAVLSSVPIYREG